MLCKYMSVSKSGYYKWKYRNEHPTLKTISRQSDIELIKEVHKKHPSHGYRWLNAYIKNKYGIVEPKITWINEERQMTIINAIPEIHRPIFLWLKYHLRRPSEAMALYKEDYDKSSDTFTIRRTFSNKKLVNHTKTHKNHHIPCHPSFKPVMESMTEHCVSPFFFTNPTGKLEGKHYQHDFLIDLWHKASASVGEKIDMYSGLKHSSCSQLINECGLSVDEVQMLTDHSRRDSVLKYAEVKVAAKRNLMARVIKFRAGFGRASESK